MSPRRPMRRIGDMLPDVARELGIADELRLSRQMAAWERLVGEHVPAAAGTSRLLSVQPPALVVSATEPRIALELRLRQAELLAAFAQTPEGVHLLELRIVVRPPRTDGTSSGRRGGPAGGPR
ncbi:MAG: DciA family protein [Candidatus Limnocylindrales bacterium]